ncbi:STY0301 family protein [Massilia sp. YIM B04103]|uniref:STY0301 family protein n=1 Tax=Massilia sp. YIM B04103 TaxID=2963106 RepID=UPI002109DD24|nr:STY0301 family protein [Massilia sp. YIM B04103]
MAMMFKLNLQQCTVAFMVAFAALTAPASAAPGLVLECPQFIEQKSVQISNVPPSWTTFVRAPLYLHGAAPMSGPPEELGELAEFSQKREKDVWVYTYQLDAPFPAGKWLACTYGESDQVTLGRKLDDNVRVCSFRYRKGRHVGENDIAIACK